MQTTLLFGFEKEKQKDDLDGYSPKRKAIITERMEKVEEHNRKCEEGKCPVCNKDLMIWHALGGKKILGCSDILCNYKGAEI